jgi:hypothetical protein
LAHRVLQIGGENLGHAVELVEAAHVKGHIAVKNLLFLGGSPEMFLYIQCIEFDVRPGTPGRG